MKQVTIGIHRDEFGEFSERWADALQRRGATMRQLDLRGSEPLDQVKGCDGVMWHWAHCPHEMRLAALPILRVIEENLRIPVFPSMATCWHYDDKIAQAYLLEAAGIPTPKTWVFWKKADALTWAQNTDYPVVAKLSGGASSANVRLIKNACEAGTYIETAFSGSGFVSIPPLATGRRKILSWGKRLVKRAYESMRYIAEKRFPSLPDQTYWMPQKNYALFQEFLPGNAYDTRVTVIGERAFAFRRFNRENDFRASGSGKIDYDASAIDVNTVRLGFEYAKRLKVQSVAFDFMHRGEDIAPLVGEISYCYANYAIAQCAGHWDSKLQWHEGHLWPEEAHVADFLQHLNSRP